MAESTPISPPEADSTPLSPVTRASSFPHKTSASATPVHAYIETNTPAINDEAVELDGAAIEPPSKHTNKQSGEDDGDDDEETKKGLKEKVKDLTGRLVGKHRKDGEIEGASAGLGDEDIDEEFLGEGGKGARREVREKRAALLSSRSKDPGVIVDVPKDPTAEEVQAARSAEGTVTPAVPESE